MIKILNLCKRFKNLIALDDISVTFEEGQVISIGPNGSGKTTLIKSILD
ncbi:MAG: ATP-binding cassette domain-containing protein [Saprospiraceae bacterium]|nr:ATP-binding cassette domain-containing protein [Saprospiraceae bacterium]